MSSNLNKIYFRFDAGGLIGFGHLGRADAIASAFEKLGLETIYLIRKRPSISNFNFKSKVLFLNEADDVTSTNPRDWISHHEENEFNDIKELLSPNSLVLIDHYGLNKIFKQKLHTISLKTASIFDIKPSEINDDFVINYNPYEEQDFNFYKSLNSQSNYMLGCKFAPISENILNYRKNEPTGSTRIKKIGVYLGGISRTMSEKFLKLLIEFIGEGNLEIEWVMNSSEDAEYFQKTFDLKNIKLINRVHDISSFYLQKDLVIGSCGVSFFERATIGIPQVLLSVANNQFDICKKIQENQLAQYLGDLEKDSIEFLKKRLNKIDSKSISVLTKNAFSLIKGDGAMNIAKTILAVY